MTKEIALLLALASVVVLIAACGGEAAQPATVPWPSSAISSGSAGF